MLSRDGDVWYGVVTTVQVKLETMRLGGFGASNYRLIINRQQSCLLDEDLQQL